MHMIQNKLWTNFRWNWRGNKHKSLNTYMIRSSRKVRGSIYCRTPIHRKNKYKIFQFSNQLNQLLMLKLNPKLYNWS